VFTAILIEFLFRLTFGVAAAMAITPSRLVTSGFFRVHLWVLLGLQTLAALAIYSLHASSPTGASLRQAQLALAIAAASASYIGAVAWLYEQRALGKALIVIISGCALAGSWLPPIMHASNTLLMQLADRATGGLVLGGVSTAMLLGHWYLNTPTMKLAPLKRLIILLAVAICLRMLVSGIGAWLEATTHLSQRQMSFQTWALFLSLRWLAGLFGVLGLAGLTWQTLKIPNTQSATGILYAGVILAFIGELMSQLLSAESVYPV
jgi:hypothetical protein